MSKPRVAVLYQAVDPPVINGTQKPKKPGGYQDSGADIAFNLSQCEDVEILTPTPDPDQASDQGWCFPDTEGGILSAIEKGATHLWANTNLFARHPLQISEEIGKYQDIIRVVGQGPLVMDRYDDKNYVNNTLLRNKTAIISTSIGNTTTTTTTTTTPHVLTLPRSWDYSTYSKSVSDLPTTLRSLNLPFPVVAKPIRGRGSYGVKVCDDLEALLAHTTDLASQGLTFMLEEYLTGEEATVTVMPPSSSDSSIGGDGDGDGEKYWALPIVTRFGHQQGVAPYSGNVAVTTNSRALTMEEMARDPAYARIVSECEAAAEILRTTAPIRVDIRRFAEGQEFAMFDVNMKPNMTGPGRPGRDNQASLTLLAATALGWDFKELLRRILGTSTVLRALRQLEPKGL